MKVLVIGGGGREHALAWKLAQSPRVHEVVVAPGNAGTAREPKLRNVPVDVADVPALLDLARAEQPELTVVGPEVPLVAGIVDAYEDAGFAVYGPDRAAARLEGSKAYAKDFLARHRIPTAKYEVHTELEPALAYARAQGAPIVVKADGLAAGKGVVVAMELAEAEQALRDMLGEARLGRAGARVVIEEFLVGEEASYIVMCDGEHALPLATSQDHKRRDDGDLGPNTGGMGAYSPAPVVTPAVEQRILREIIEPTLAGMAADGCRFSGFLYAGVMVAADGTPKVLEFNVRFGDPETQPIMMRLRSDLVALVEAALAGRLDRTIAEWDPRPAIGVVMAAGGYPGEVRKGDPIGGLDAVPAGDIKVFHAATRDEGGRVLTNGGRVLTVCALGDTVAAAQAAAYRGVDAIRWTGAFCRRDIGWRAIGREGIAGAL
ncbi:MAG: phosphoribosylamine--glycine ligase [Xanthomonadales bacterium]|nr:phosphoribosylamine--glycine ligase [Xanthomonadales bacterium]